MPHISTSGTASIAVDSECQYSGKSLGSTAEPSPYNSVQHQDLIVPNCRTVLVSASLLMIYVRPVTIQLCSRTLC